MRAVPTVIDDTLPEASIDAIAGLEEDHIPPLTASVNKVKVPRQTEDGPTMKPVGARGLTVKGWVAIALPQPFVTV